jgi:NADPH2:quinone reductase
MKALRFHEFGDISRLKLEDVPDAAPGKGEIKVSVRAASINPSDVKNVQGRMQGTTLPRTPGRDFAGVVVVGPGELQGREVWGTGGDLGFTRDGTHAEFVIIPAAAAAAKPANLSFEEAACAGVNFVTAYEGLIRRAKLRPKEVVLVTGAGGGVGAAVLELVQAHDARPIAVDRKPYAEADYERVKLLGYVDASKQELVEAVRKIAGGRGVNVAFDCVGGALFEPVLSTLGQFGRHVCITSVGERRVSLDLLDFYHRSLTLIGVDSRPLGVEDCARLLEEMTPLFVSGELKPARIARRGSLTDAVQLYAAVERGAGGKVIVTRDA